MDLGLALYMMDLGLAPCKMGQALYNLALCFLELPLDLAYGGSSSRRSLYRIAPSKACSEYEHVKFYRLPR